MLKRHSLPCSQRGFSLIELLIAMTTSLILLSGLVYIFTSFTRSNTDMIKMIRLQQELRGIMTIMVNDIRRAGYWSQAGRIPTSNIINRFAVISIINGDCILYSYDAQQDDSDGNPDSDDYAGFKLERHSIKIRSSAGRCVNGQCNSCNTGTWWTLNDNHVVHVTRLRFRQTSRIFPYAQGAMQMNVRRIEIILSGTLAQAPDITYTLQDSVYIPNAAITPIL